jgi:hypothetical protein
MTRRRGVGKAGIDRGREDTSLSSASVRCATLRRDNLGKTFSAILEHVPVIVSRFSGVMAGLVLDKPGHDSE